MTHPTLDFGSLPDSRSLGYFSQRGSSVRQAHLEAAIRRGVARFEAQWQATVTTEIQVKPQTAVGEPCLQVVDYMNWAVYRAFVKREMRTYRFVEDKVSLLVDRGLVTGATSARQPSAPR